MKKYGILVVDLFVFVVLSGIIHLLVAMIAREWAWFASNVLSLAIIGYLRVEELHRTDELFKEFLRVSEDVSKSIDDILNPGEEPHN